MRIAAASQPSSSDRDNEDFMFISQDVIVILDGATARTDTGCHHGVAWYAAHLGGAIGAQAADRSVALRDALSQAISDVAAMHPECDLSHEGTPSAAAGVVRENDDQIEYLVLGDVTLLLDAGEAGLRVIVDNRVDTTALAERAEQDRYAIGSPEKQAAMLRMKRAELAARNKPGGFFVAAADPTVPSEAIVGVVQQARVTRLALMTDGAARAVVLFNMMTWSELMGFLAKSGPDAVINAVRKLELSDPLGLKWPRNKQFDDATALVVTF